MPKIKEIKSVLVIGAGPIIIGQACEFDYAGVQACKALRESGCRIVLINSNPATIMTDPNLADATYIEPIHWKVIEEIIKKEQPDAILPIVGGQTALNCFLDLERRGILEKYGVRAIGVSAEGVENSESRFRFSELIEKLGLKAPRSMAIKTLEDAKLIVTQLSYPILIRSSFALGGEGSKIVKSSEALLEFCKERLAICADTELLAEETVLGWKEFELEVMRDSQDHCIVVCTVENFDPMGIHTGDSITVAPAQTLTDKEYQLLRNAAFNLIRALKIVGGCNVQFAVNPVNGDFCVIEVNPRVSRSSALVSKATGYPIAKVAAKLALGYSLLEINNEATNNNRILAFFEPTIDYVVVKIPRFDFEKFPLVSTTLTTAMKSIGEAMAIGRNFQEALQKAICSLDIGLFGFERPVKLPRFQMLEKLKMPTSDRLWFIGDAFREEISIEEIFQATNIDPWFLSQIANIIHEEHEIVRYEFSALDKATIYRLKRKGFSDKRLADLFKVSETKFRDRRESLGVLPVYKRVDTCGAEFPTKIAYFYSTYENESEVNASHENKVIVLGSGPNRIGQGIEFDYCCVHAASALKEAGYESIMINCNPETVSTDYDTADRLYFEPLTLEHVLGVIKFENPLGVLTQFGGQTPLRLAKVLAQCGINLLGNSSQAVETAEDRYQFYQFLRQINVKSPTYFTAEELESNVQILKNYAFPLIVRPSFVLGGYAIQVAYSEKELLEYLEKTRRILKNTTVLIESFLEDALEVEVDLIFDGQEVLIPELIEQIEPAGVHSGDSSCVIPAYELSEGIKQEIKMLSAKIAMQLGIIGALNIQFAIKDSTVFAFEVNPRASRTLPFLEKSTGLPLVKMATLCVLGKKLSTFNMPVQRRKYCCLKEAVFSFQKLGVKVPVIDAQMRSTGEIMTIGLDISQAFSKALLAVNLYIPEGSMGLVVSSEKNSEHVVDCIKTLISGNYRVIVNKGLMAHLEASSFVSLCESELNTKSEVDALFEKEHIKFIINIADADFKERTMLLLQMAQKRRIFYTTYLRKAAVLVHALSVSPFYPIFCLQELF